MRIFLLTVALGFAGLDPIGGVIVMSAIAHKTPKSKVIAFSVIALLSTVTLIVLISFCLRAGVLHAYESMGRGMDEFFLVLDFVVAIVAGAWFIKRAFFKAKTSDAKGKPSEAEDKEESKLSKSARKNLPLAGVLLSFWIMTDPIFWSFVTMIAREGGLIFWIFLAVVWVFLSQIPLFVLTIAMAFGSYEKLLERIDRFLDKNNRREKLKKVTHWGINLFILVVSVYFFVEAGIYLATGTWI